MFFKEIQTYLLFIYSVKMFVFIPGSIPPVRFWPAETDPPEIFISPVTYINYKFYIYDTFYMHKEL